MDAIKEGTEIDQVMIETTVVPARAADIRSLAAVQISRWTVS